MSDLSSEFSHAYAFVADIGGTNARLALIGPNGLIEASLQRFSNADYESFTQLAAAYLADKPALSRAVIAVAGPVSAGIGRLTNRDWHFDAGEISEHLGIAQVDLLNDLAALGHAIALLPQSAVTPLASGDGYGCQAIVVGLGTGFNVSLADLQSGTVFSCEMGHAALPESVARLLDGEMGDAASQRRKEHFATIEALFSGQGFAKLHLLLSGESCRPEEVFLSSSGAQTRLLHSKALGVLLREIAYLYMPERGIYLNGSLARGLASYDAGALIEPVQSDPAFDGRIARIPLFLITEDGAALHGCAGFAQNGN